MEKWYQKKKFYVPVSIVLGLLGVGACMVTLFDVGLDDELNSDYYKSKDEPLWIKKDKMTEPEED